MELKQQLLQVGVRVADEQERQLLAYVDELLRWNRSINLTAIHDRDEALEKHLVDALTLVPLLRGSERLLDMGSGAGLPGIPLKIVLPELTVLSVDSVAKKISFQRQIIRLLGLQGIEARHARLEALADEPTLQGAFTVVVARAFASLGDCARYARPFLAPSGRLLAMKGPEGAAELHRAGAELAGLGLVCSEELHLRLPVSGAERLLLVLSRVDETTARDQ